jgi:hypothetical protein
MLHHDTKFVQGRTICRAGSNARVAALGRGRKRDRIPSHFLKSRSEDFVRTALMYLFTIGILILLSTPSSAQNVTISVISKNLSHRIVLLDRVETRLKLMIGFKTTGTLPNGPAGTKAEGALVHDGTNVATYTVPKMDFNGGNLIFYLPYNIEAGNYEISIRLSNISNGATVATMQTTLSNIELLTAREGSSYNWMQPSSLPLQNPNPETLGAISTAADRTRGYILWQRNAFRYVYPNSAPTQDEVVDRVNITCAQDEYEPATFSVYALQNLGDVSVQVSNLSEPGGAALSPPQLYVVKTVARIRSNRGNAYEMRPRWLAKQNFIAVAANTSQRFWLTVYSPPTAKPGTYSGAITVTTSLGSTQIPLQVEVLPFALERRPDKEYGFMMTYEFQEMVALDLSDTDRQKVYANGVKYYRSFKEHGLTAIFPHSPFVLQRLPNGDPDLRDLQAAMSAYREVGWDGPFIYYCGHLVQSSKPGWAGSTLNYDANRHPQLLKDLITYTRTFFPDAQNVDLYWMPGDEVQDDRGGPDRTQIASQLLNAIFEKQEKSAITAWESVAWPVDIYFGSPAPTHGAYWNYPNDTTTVPPKVDDAESLRRSFGVAHVKSSYVGITPWTFQTSENASGDPMSDIDTQMGSAEVMIAYPGVDGPTLTPEYEAVREGIDDGKYCYQLQKRIASAKNSQDSTLRSLGLEAEAALQQIMNNADDATLLEMESNRRSMITWILALEAAGPDVAPPRNLRVVRQAP